MPALTGFSTRMPVNIEKNFLARSTCSERMGNSTSIKQASLSAQLMNSKNPTGYLAKPSTLPLARASRHAGTRDLGKTLHSRDGVNLHHPLYLLPNGPVVKEE